VEKFKQTILGADDRDESPLPYLPLFGKIIDFIELKDSILTIRVGGLILVLEDHMQICCEHRSFSTDDNLKEYEGAALVDIELKSAPDVNNIDEDDDYYVHNVNFLDIITSKGVFTIVAHNVHNGYYGGFDIYPSIVEV
jgi:hypothetical protein